MPDRLPENKLTTAVESWGLMHRCEMFITISENFEQQIQEVVIILNRE
jgi:hypothetical protein